MVLKVSPFLIMMFCPHFVVLSALGVDGLPYAATIGEEEFHASGITFEGLDSGIEFLADGGIL